MACSIHSQIVGQRLKIYAPMQLAIFSLYLVFKIKPKKDI